MYPVDKGFGFPKTYPLDNDLSTIQKDKTCERSCRLLVCQRPDHISFHVESAKCVCWSALDSAIQRLSNRALEDIK